MNRAKGPIFIGLLALSAFLWGYRRDLIKTGWFNFLSPFFSSEQTETQAKSVVTTDKPKERPVVTKAPNPMNAADVYKQLSVVGAKPPPRPIRKNPSFSETLQSIKAGKVGEKKKAKRNLYFEKLSQQLKELQGQKPLDADSAKLIPPSGTPGKQPAPPPKPAPRLEPPRTPPPKLEPPIAAIERPRDDQITDEEPPLEVDEQDLDNLSPEDLDELEQVLDDLDRP